MSVLAAATKRVWIALVIAAVIAVGGYVVLRIHRIFGADHYSSPTAAGANDIKPFNPKRVTLEVFGPAGTVADINYLDVQAIPQRVDHATLPWEYRVATMAPAVSVNVVAQGDSESIGCRITVNDDVKDEQITTGTNAQTFCLVKSA